MLISSDSIPVLHEPQQSIFSLSLHPAFPNPPLAVTGGEDDLAYIFSPIPSSSSSSDTFSPIKLTGHTDSVIATGWSFDGDMVATGGMDGRVRVWRRSRSRRNSRVENKGGTGTAESSWKDWEFLTSLETGSEVQVSRDSHWIPIKRAHLAHTDLQLHAVAHMASEREFPRIRM